ncbi:MAG TPA: aldehyde dehydrogenase family protein, partial [Capillimicrobium sp.]
ARRAFDAGPWPRMTGADRARALRRFAELVDGRRDALAALDSEEGGKPIRMTRGEIDGVVGHIEYAASLAHTDHGTAWTELDAGFVAYASHVPLGVAALIVPWNFPALIAAQKLPYALAAGCTTVIKPSELTSSSALELARLAHEAGLPAGTVNVVTGLGPTTGAALVAHPGVDVISFTGSTATGRRVAAQAGADLKRVGLELGGKAANVVFADADLERAADAAVHAAFFNQGECCVSGSRLLVQDAVADDFLAAVVARARELVVGDPADEDTDIGPMIHGDHLERVLSYVAAGHDEGAALLTGGRRLDDAPRAGGFFVEPTVFDDVAPTARIFREEIFGPVLSAARFADIDEAIRLANATDYGLSNAVWTSNVATAQRVSAELRSGTVWVNTNIDGAPALAFGGMGASGLGREVGLEGLREYTASKTVQIRSGERELPFPRRAGA